VAFHLLWWFLTRDVFVQQCRIFSQLLIKICPTRTNIRVQNVSLKIINILSTLLCIKEVSINIHCTLLNLALLIECSKFQTKFMQNYQFSKFTHINMKTINVYQPWSDLFLSYDKSSVGDLSIESRKDWASLLSPLYVLSGTSVTNTLHATDVINKWRQYHALQVDVVLVHCGVGRNSQIHEMFHILLWKGRKRSIQYLWIHSKQIHITYAVISNCKYYT